MTLSKTCILAGVFGLFSLQAAYAASLDELYRDIIRSDNRGYLPLFVKNRHAPVTLADDEDFADYQAVKSSLPEGTGTEVVNLSNNYKNPTALAKARQLQWLKTIAAVKANQVTPLELNDITTRVKENDPKATEILAWMYTNGVGVSTDFIEAFNLYKKAATLNVANAEKNALAVYKSMNEEQRRFIKNRSTLPQPLSPAL